MKQFQERYTSKDGELHVWPENLHRPDLSMIGDGLYDSDKFLPLIRRMMVRVNAKVLILDNLTFLVNNGGMKAEDVKPICQEFCSWAKEGYSILVVNHTPKIQPFTLSLIHISEPTRRRDSKHAHQLRTVGLRHRNGQQQSLDGQICETAQEQERQDSMGREPCDTLCD